MFRNYTYRTSFLSDPHPIPLLIQSHFESCHPVPIQGVTTFWAESFSSSPRSQNFRVESSASCPSSQRPISNKFGVASCSYHPGLLPISEHPPPSTNKLQWFSLGSCWPSYSTSFQRQTAKSNKTKTQFSHFSLWYKLWVTSSSSYHLGLLHTSKKSLLTASCKSFSLESHWPCYPTISKQTQEAANLNRQ